MDSKVELYIKRARTEMNMAIILLKSSGSKTLNEFNISEDETFYSGVISHCYYSIFYMAKAMLVTRGIETKSPEVHKKTLDAFKEQFIDTGILDVKLFLMYQKMVIRADDLLGIFKIEKKKRGDFTYNTIAQANSEPAHESLEHAKLFFKHASTCIIQ